MTDVVPLPSSADLLRQRVDGLTGSIRAAAGLPSRTAAGDFEEEKHDRHADGKFAPKGAGDAGAVKEEAHAVGVSDDPNSQSLHVAVKREPGESDSDFNDRVFKEGQEHYEPVTALHDAASGYREQLGLPEPQIDDWTSIKADMARAEVVGQAFSDLVSRPDDPEVKAAYADLVTQATAQYKLLTDPVEKGGMGVKVDFVSPDDIKRDYGDKEGLNPYPTAADQARDLRENKHLAIASIADYPGAYHPMLTNTRGGEYDTFRAVHDAFGHAAIGADFTRHGEFQAWMHHVSMFEGPAARAASTELTGENSYLFTTGNPAQHKAALIGADVVDPWTKDGTINPWGEDGQLLAKAAAVGADAVAKSGGGDDDVLSKWGVVKSADALLGKIAKDAKEHAPQTAAPFDPLSHAGDVIATVRARLASIDPEEIERETNGRFARKGAGTTGADPAGLEQRPDVGISAYRAVRVSDGDFTALKQGSMGKDIIGRNEDGTLQLTPAKQAEIDAFVAKAVEGIPAPVGQPTFSFLGGGAAAGKSTMLKDGGFDVPGPQSAVLINADTVKGEMPVYREMLAKGDPNAAGFVHEESSYISKMIQQEAINRGQNIVLDGTGDSSATKLIGKVEAAREAGYQVNGYYATVPTEVAVQRGNDRGNDPTSDSFGRFVPLSQLVDVHASVSRIFPEIAPHFDKVALMDTTNSRTTGSVLLAESTRDKGLVVHDEAGYQKFLDKAQGYTPGAVDYGPTEETRRILAERLGAQQQ